MSGEVAWSRRARWALEEGAVATIERLAGLVPDRAVPRLGSMIGALAYLVDARHRRIALDNLEQAFGKAMTAAERRTLVRGSFGHFARVGVEILRFRRLSPETIGRLADHEGIEHLQAAHARGRGVLICAAHFGNWELHALLQAWAGFPLTLVTRPLDNPALERRITSLRARSGNTIIDKRLSLDALVRVLRQGGSIGVLVDQRPRRSGVIVPFFGRGALTSPAPALLALRTGAALLPAFSIPRPDGTYRLVYEPEIAIARTGKVDEDAKRLAAAYTACVERVVRQHPAIWLWMHDRWRVTAAPDQSRSMTK